VPEPFSLSLSAWENGRSSAKADTAFTSAVMSLWDDALRMRGERVAPHALLISRP
jgi:hypothetical protein